MQGTRMVPLTAVPSEFAGRVLVAKLGSAGILAELRGVSRIYPSLLGSPQVWVEASELADATELISTDVDDVLAPDPDRDPDSGAGPTAVGRWWFRPVMAAIALVLLVSFGYGARSCSPQGATNTIRTP